MNISGNRLTAGKASITELYQFSPEFLAMQKINTRINDKYIKHGKYVKSWFGNLGISNRIMGIEAEEAIECY